MLILGRKSMQRIHIGENIVITVLEIQRNRVTLGVDLDVNCAVWDDETEEEELQAADCTRFRAIAARCNDLQTDRPDIQYAITKQLSIDVEADGQGLGHA